MTAQDSYHVSVEGLEIDALPICTWEHSWQLFEDNLPAIGLLAVWVELRDSSAKEIDLGNVKWELSRGTERLRSVSLERVFKQYYKQHHTRFYSVNADRNARESLAKWILRPGRLQPSESRRGFLFFQAGSAQSPDWNRGAVLIMNGFPGEGAKRSEQRNLELPLFHAHP